MVEEAVTEKGKGGRFAPFGVLSKRGIVCLFVIALCFGIALTMGMDVLFLEPRGTMQQNHIGPIKANLGRGVLFGLGAFVVSLGLSVVVARLRLRFDVGKRPDAPRWFFFVAWGLIFLLWLPYLLTFYPGGIVGDGAETIELALADEKTDFTRYAFNHWVVFSILVMRFFLWLGGLFSSDPNVGVFLYSLVSCLLFSATCAAICTWVRRQVRGCAPLAWLCVAMFALSGFFASYGFCLWKDGLFSCGIVLLMMLLWQVLADGNLDVRRCVMIALLVLFVCFWRNNGIPVIALCVVAWLFLLRKRGLKFVGVCGAALAFALVVQGPVYNALGVSKDGLIEPLSVPVQQIGAVVAHREPIEEHQAEVIFSVLPKEKWIEDYSPMLSDDLKFALDKEYLSTHLGEFLGVWVEMMPAHFMTYARAYSTLTLGFWQPNSWMGETLDYWVGVQDPFQRGFTEVDQIQNLTGFSLKGIFNLFVLFIPSGTMVWLMWLSFGLVATQRNERRWRMAVLVPLIACWVVVMMATPISYAYRYVLMIALALPLLVVVPFASLPGEKQAKHAR